MSSLTAWPPPQGAHQHQQHWFLDLLKNAHFARLLAKSRDALQMMCGNVHVNPSAAVKLTFFINLQLLVSRAVIGSQLKSTVFILCAREIKLKDLGRTLLPLLEQHLKVRAVCGWVA